MDKIITQRHLNWNKIEINVKNEHKNYSLKQRKKRLDEQHNKRRLLLINKTTNGIELDLLNISFELKTSSTILRITKSKTYDEIFIYLNEIYNTSSYNQEYLKYGLYLLRTKLSEEDEESTDENQIKEDDTNDSSAKKNIQSLIDLGFLEIPKKVFNYAKSELLNNDLPSNRDIDDIIYEMYWILINFAYYATEAQILPLITEEYMDYHYSLLKNISDNNTIANIIMFLANVSLLSYNVASFVLEYKDKTGNMINDENTINYGKDTLLELILQYITSAMLCDHKNKLYASCDLLHNYIKVIKLDKPKQYNIVILEKIFEVFINVLSYKLLYEDSLWSIKFISSHCPSIFKLILSDDHLDIFTLMAGFNYNDPNYHESLYSVIGIIGYLFKHHGHSHSHYDQLYEILEQFSPFFLTILEQHSNNKRMKLKVLKSLYMILGSNLKFIQYLIEKEDDLLKMVIEQMKDSYRNIKNMTFDIMILMTSNNSFTINSTLVTNGLYTTVIGIINPENNNNIDCDILIKALAIINNCLIAGQWIEEITKVNSYAIKFERLGGLQILEKLLGHPNRAIYKHAEYIIDKYFKSNINEDCKEEHSNDDTEI